FFQSARRPPPHRSVYARRPAGFRVHLQFVVRLRTVADVRFRRPRRCRKFLRQHGGSPRRHVDAVRRPLGAERRCEDLRRASQRISEHSPARSFVRHPRRTPDARLQVHLQIRHRSIGGENHTMTVLLEDRREHFVSTSSPIPYDKGRKSLAGEYVLDLPTDTTLSGALRQDWNTSFADVLTWR